MLCRIIVLNYLIIKKCESLMFFKVDVFFFRVNFGFYIIIIVVFIYGE